MTSINKTFGPPKVCWQQMKDPKIAKFILEQELPPDSTPAPQSSDTKQPKAKGSSLEGIKVLDHVRQINLEACRDPHLEKYLPHLLDSQLCRTVDSRWIIANPVHSLHLASQMDESLQQPQQNLQHLQQQHGWKQNPLLFGDEEQRTIVIKSKGIAETWSPMDGTSAAIEEDRIVEPASSSSHFSDMVSSARSVVPPFSSSTTMPMQSASAQSAMPGIPSPSDVIAMDVDTGQAAAQKPSMTPQQIASSPTNSMTNTSSPARAQAMKSKPTPSSNQINPKPMGGKNLSAIKNAVSTPKNPAAVTSNESAPPKPSSGVAADQMPSSTTAGAVHGVQMAINRSNRKVETPGQGTQAALQGCKAQASTSATGASAITVPDNTTSAKKEGSPTSAGASNEGQNNKTNATAPPRQGKGKGGKGLLFAKQAILANSSPNASSSRAPSGSSATAQQTVQPKTDDQKPVENVPSCTLAPGAIASATSSALNQSTDADGGTVKMGSSNAQVPSTTTSTTQGQGVPPTCGQTPENKTGINLVDKAVNFTPTLPTTVSSTPRVGAAAPHPHGLPDEHYHQFSVAENSVDVVRRSITTYGRTSITNKKKSESAKKKRKKDHEFFRCTPVPGWVAPPPKVLNTRQEGEWSEARRTAPETVERWIENFRISRESYWSERSLKKSATQQGMMMGNNGSFYLPTQESSSATGTDGQSGKFSTRKRSRVLKGDELMTCLECGAILPSPKSIVPGSSEGVLEHMLISGHKFAVTCGERAQVFSFGGGDFVYHEVFDQEKFRIDTMKQLPKLSWKEHKVQRSFDPFQFISTNDFGIVWRGPVATYPALVPKVHLCATELIHRRKALFEGRLREKWLLTKPNAMAFAASQHLLDETDRYQIDAPVGIYNLGNTCYMTAILQCLVHCIPLQEYFLEDSAHHYKASKVYHNASAEESAQVGTSTSDEKSAPKEKKEAEQCLASEMDRLFLSYYGSAIGHDVLAVIEESSHNLSFAASEADDTYAATETPEVDKGEPLIPSSLLATIWRCEHLKHLAGYKQHDAHEFLNSFLEQMSKNIKQHRDRVVESIKTARDDNCVDKIFEEEADVVTRLFQGQLRSVLLCEECGTKRVQAEPFMNISLTLSEEVERLERESNSGGDGAKLSVQTCLDHYVLPERLADSVECPHCEKRTSTKTQHSFSKLPKILCLHLKRFDAARNKKIEESVSFPAQGLNMGPMLSHWSEVSSILSSKKENGTNTEPRILYDLFGTANHLGNMQSGHYVSNVKVKDQWYHCNDQHVSRAGDGSGEEAVLNSEGAYILFYVRR